MLFKWYNNANHITLQMDHYLKIYIRPLWARKLIKQGLLATNHLCWSEMDHVKLYEELR